MSPFKVSTALLVLLTAMLTSTQCDAIRNYDFAPPALCLQPPYTGPCKARFIRWYFNANSGSCEEFVFGGCRRKMNNFVTERDCKSICKTRGTVKREVVAEDAKPGEGELPTGAEELALAKRELAPEGEEPAPKGLEFKEEQESFKEPAPEK